MYLDDLLKNYQDLNCFKAGATTYPAFYKHWRQWLYSFASKIYSIEIEDIPHKEVMNRLIFRGMCGIIKKRNKLIAVDVTLFDNTDYYDEFKNFNYSSVWHSGKRTIGKDGVLMELNPIRQGSYYIIHHYATILAHIEVSLINALINGRSNKVIVATTEKASQSAKAYRDSLYKGSPEPIVDKSFIGLDFKDMNTIQTLSVMELYDLKTNVLTSFYEDIGVKRSNEKRERLLNAEVSANNGLLKINLEDQLESIQKGCEEITHIFGKKATVKCNVDLDDNGTIDEGGISDESQRTV